VRAVRSETKTIATRGGKVVAAVQGAAESGLPSWLGFLRVPMIVPIIVYAAAYMISTIFTVTPDATWWGSYQRLQGTYSQYSYMLLGIIVIANLRTRVQLERLISFMVLTSLPVVLYGLAQWARLDPLPWAGDTATRVASTMGNAIFVAAWLIMVVPFALYRLLTGLNSSPVVEHDEPAVIQNSNYGWAVVANSMGILMISALVFFMALKMMAGLPYPDARTWWVLPLALAFFYAGCWLIERMGRRSDDPVQVSLYLPAIGAALFFVSLLALPLEWSIDRSDTANLTLQIGFDWLNMWWVLFMVALWAAITSLAYSLSNSNRTWTIVSAVLWAMLGFIAYVISGVIIWEVFFLLLWGALTVGMRAFASTRQEAGDLTIPYALNVGYAALILMQLFCIYLTQSRGPWLGLGAGLVVFAVAMWLVGRNRQVRWMRRIGGAVTAVVVALVLFVGALNIPSSPLKGLENVPVVGRGIERLSTLTQTETGTGKVRTLIWKGAADLILSNPARSIIGWGPEAMYVAYNKFYPAELAQVELRNATPDRSHNVEFDQLVTLGLLGLMAYYFLVGAFFFYGIRVLKQAHNTRDQMFIIALLSAMTAHFIEIQTGIQIAATWTYFYLMIGMLVAFGFYITNSLRPSATVAYAEAVNLRYDGRDPTKIDEENEHLVVAAAPVASSVTTSVSRGAGSARGKSKTIAASAAVSKSRTGGVTSEVRRRKTTQSALLARTANRNRLVTNPVMLALYALLLVAALVFAWTVNSGTVRADTLYKQGQAWDSAQRWPESISYYKQAIDTQPNQDYYYLFLGRAWLEFAKQVDREQVNFRTSTTANPVEYASDQDRSVEKAQRLLQSEGILKRAQAINPLNTDHYANLGRLYLYWADPTGAQNPSKSQLAVDFMKEATNRTPGNAQLRDELAVAYARNGQFTEAVEALNFSRNTLDRTFARTPFILGQLYQERALQVKAALASNTELPKGGETDYGKLMLEAGRAYSDTIGVDIAQFVDTNFPVRVDFLLDASEPFTATNTTLDPAAVRNVLTSTVSMALESQVPSREKEVARVLRARAVYNGTEDLVPGEALRLLWNDPGWASAAAGGSRGWLDDEMGAVTRNAMIAHTGLGYIYSKVDRRADALKAYDRSVLLTETGTEEQVATQISQAEGDVAQYLQARGVYTDTATAVPETLLQTLWRDPQWANGNRWTNEQLATLTDEAALLNANLGHVYVQMREIQKAQTRYNRAITLSPGDERWREEQSALGGTSP
ncbi:MAG: O-antigen ligase family protein, partial [Chloroflexia bacterium]